MIQVSPRTLCEKKGHVVTDGDNDKDTPRDMAPSNANQCNF